MFDHAWAFIDRKAVEFPVVFRMSQPYCRGTQRPWIGKPGNENIGNIVGLLGPEDIVVSSVTKVSVIQREIRKGNISSYLLLQWIQEGPSPPIFRPGDPDLCTRGSGDGSSREIHRKW